MLLNIRLIGLVFLLCISAYLFRIEKSLKDQGFTVRRVDHTDIKRIWGLYFEQSLTRE